MDERLILLVQSHPELWDTRSPTYKDSEMKDNTWHSIASELQMDALSLSLSLCACASMWVRLYHDVCVYIYVHVYKVPCADDDTAFVKNA